MKHLISLLTLACAASGVQAEELFVKGVVFPEGADSITKIELAGRVVPTPQQLAWQQRPLTAFLHFGMNTFTNREWGDGKESPELFNPKLLDTDQWVRTLKDAGFEMVILTAKHHDGFCLWPTATTSHSVASSPWRDGKGDVVADLRRSCDKYGMKLGLYLSPWDRNAQCYGSEAYNDLFVAQLTELLTNYGKVDEVWFDGACGEGPNGKKQVYDWLRFRDTMRDLQPDAVLAITGDDVRWVGNEGGRGRETEWSVTPLVPKVYAFADSVNKALDMNEMSPSLGGRDVVSRASQVFWWPAEVDVSIRPGWFYHETEQPHPMSRMARIYLESVGRNATLLLNIPPDTDGLISPADCQRLAEFHNWIQTNFQTKQLPGRIYCVE
ncbi:MAG: alpha-L-fucosidase, partial [Paramuribaculum sp.]|nr:alpha-L-fucosidase [Paramuribaculum sp.]